MLYFALVHTDFYTSFQTTFADLARSFLTLMLCFNMHTVPSIFLQPRTALCHYLWGFSHAYRCFSVVTMGTDFSICISYTRLYSTVPHGG